jgi:Fe/S biogenesis protein NfuA
VIHIGPTAQDHFRRLLDQQAPDALGIRLRAVHGGTPAADCQLEFCEDADLRGDEWIVECEGFKLYVEAGSVAWLDNAHIDMKKSDAGAAQLTIKAPKLKGEVPGADASLVERVRYVLEAEINPGLASHKGHVRLEEVTSDGVVVLRFGGGCHGCGMVETTVREGIERTLRTRIPEVTAVRDATDHSTGENPYIRA